jgi:hypothetical protein
MEIESTTITLARWVATYERFFDRMIDFFDGRSGFLTYHGFVTIASSSRIFSICIYNICEYYRFCAGCMTKFFYEHLSPSESSISGINLSY